MGALICILTDIKAQKKKGKSAGLFGKGQGAWSWRNWSWWIKATVEAKWYSLFFLFYLLLSTKNGQSRGSELMPVCRFLLFSPVSLPALTVVNLHRLWCYLRVWTLARSQLYWVWDGPSCGGPSAGTCKQRGRGSGSSAWNLIVLYRPLRCSPLARRSRTFVCCRLLVLADNANNNIPYQGLKFNVSLLVPRFADWDPVSTKKNAMKHNIPNISTDQYRSHGLVLLQTPTHRK